MVTLDGVEYPIKTVDENAAELVEYINNYCSENNIVNTQDEIIQITESTANPLYILLYALAYQLSIVQNLIYSAGCSFSIPESSESQLLNLANIAGIKRNEATKTSINCTVYAATVDTETATTEELAATMEITTTNTCTVQLGSYNLTFHPAFDVSCPVNEVRNIILICEDYGSYNISEGAIAGFDEEIENFRKIESQASIPGQDQESISSLRSRLQRRTEESSMADKAASAIKDLSGVAFCSIYFNESSTSTAYVGTRSLPVLPRHALIMVQGYSDSIAQTFLSHMICETAGEDFDSEVGAYSQIYTTHASQEITVWVIPPVQTPVYINVYVNNVVSDDEVSGIKDAIGSLSGVLSIGESLTSAQVLEKCQEAYPSLTFQGAMVSTSTVDTSYSFVATPPTDGIFVFNISNMNIISTIGS